MTWCSLLPRAVLVLLVLAVNAWAQPIEYLRTDGTNDMTGRLDLADLASYPAGVNGSTYYNTASNRFRCFAAGSWGDCAPFSAITGTVANDQVVCGTGTTTVDSNSGLTCVGSALTGGTLTSTGAVTAAGQMSTTHDPASTGVTAASILANPATCATDEVLIGSALAGVLRSTLDCEGDFRSPGSSFAFGRSNTAGNTAGFQINTSGAHTVGSTGITATASNPGFVSLLTLNNSTGIGQNVASVTSSWNTPNDGTLRVIMGATSASSRLTLTSGAGRINLGSTGTAALPGVMLGGYTVDDDTGLYRPGADQIGVSTGGVSRAIFGNLSLDLAVPLQVTDTAGNGTCTLNTAATATCTATVITGCDPTCTDTQPATNGVAAIACSVSGTTLTATSSVANDGSVVRFHCM